MRKFKCIETSLFCVFNKGQTHIIFQSDNFIINKHGRPFSLNSITRKLEHSSIINIKNKYLGFVAEISNT